MFAGTCASGCHPTLTRRLLPPARAGSGVDRTYEPTHLLPNQDDQAQVSGLPSWGM